MTGIDRKQAVVIGGSMAGLLAARVLSDHFEKVLVVERDTFPEGPEQRRGVPHGRHAHAILASGLQVIEETFPGVTSEMVAAGALEADPALDGTWFFEGACLKRTESGTKSILSSRPFLETHLRTRLLQLPNVTAWDGQSVQELIRYKNRVIGIATDRGRVVSDLVVDASGRGTQLPRWLESVGYERPAEERVEVDLCYTTRVFRRCPGEGDCSFRLVTPTPEGKCGGVILAMEDDRWIVTLFGHFGRRAPEDLDGFLHFAKNLPSPAIFDMIRESVPLGPPCSFRFPASTRRRYERLRRFPDGLVAFGDAICSFNPIYGQGMSSAALQARALKKALRGPIETLSKNFFADAAKVIDGPWSIAVGSDLKMPETSGPRSKMVNVINWYMDRLHRAAHRDSAATLAFIRVAQLLDPPTSIFHPRVLFRVLLANLLPKAPEWGLRTETSAVHQAAETACLEMDRG